MTLVGGDYMLRHYRRKQRELKASKPTKYERMLRQLLEKRKYEKPMVEDRVEYDYYGR